MKRIIISTLGLALLLGLGAGIALPAKDASAQQTRGQMPMMGQDQMPMMRHGMMRHGMMRHGMMGQGMGGQGKMAPGMGPWVVPIKHLSTDEVRHFLEHRLDGQGYKRLKVGSVEEKDNGTISAEIVTVEGSLVQRLEVDRHTGLIMQVE